MNDPIRYSRELSDKICARIAEGETLSAICREPGMPTKSAVSQWASRDEDGFAERYACARNQQIEQYADEIVALGDSVVDKRVDSAAVQAAKNAADNRKWLLSKLRPGQYGDRITHAGDTKAPLFPGATAADLEARIITALMAKGLTEEEARAVIAER